MRALNPTFLKASFLLHNKQSQRVQQATTLRAWRGPLQTRCAETGYWGARSEFMLCPRSTVIRP